MTSLHSFPSIDHPTLFSKYSCFLLDAYGVFWGGNACGAYPGAFDTMKRLVDSGKIVGVLSNSSATSQREIAKYHKAGCIQGTHYHFFVTSGDLAKDAFKTDSLPFPTPAKKVAMLFPPHPIFNNERALFEESPFQMTSDPSDCDFIYINVPHLEDKDQTEIELFRPYLKSFFAFKKPMVCANPDLVAHEGNPARLVVRQGFIAALYEKMGGQVIYMGKPSQIAFRAALNHIQKLSPSNPSILMVGDTPETDIRGAVSSGIDSALICTTGIMGDRIKQKGHEALKELPLSDHPTFLLERFSPHAL